MSNDIAKKYFFWPPRIPTLSKFITNCKKSKLRTPIPIRFVPVQVYTPSRPLRDRWWWWWWVAKRHDAMFDLRSSRATLQCPVHAPYIHATDGDQPPTRLGWEMCTPSKEGDDLKSSLKLGLPLPKQGNFTKHWMLISSKRPHTYAVVRSTRRFSS